MNNDLPTVEDDDVDLYDVTDPDAAAEAKAKADEKAKTVALAKEVERWTRKVDHGREHMKQDRERWAKDRKLAAGDDGGAKWEVDANLIGSICEVILAFLYAKNPDVCVRVAPSAGRANVAQYKVIAETLEIVVSRLLKDAGLKRKAKRWVRSAMTVGVGWLNAGMQTRRENDPIVEKDINDLQNNLRAYDASKALIESGYCIDEDQERATMESNLLALQARLELVIGTGLTLDVKKPEDVVVSPECAEVEDYFDAPWISYDFYKTKSDALALASEWGVNAEAIMRNATTYMQKPRQGDEVDTTGGVDFQPAPDADSQTDEGFVRMTEIWCHTDGTVRTYIEGIKDRWLRDQYAPRTWSKFYPSFLLTFNPVDGLRYAQSDVSRLRSLQTEYSRTRSSQATHRRRAIPGCVFDATNMSPEDVKKLENSTQQEYIGITPLRDMPNGLAGLIVAKMYNPMDIALYDASSIKNDMEQISGASEALQSAVSVEKTATEARIQNTGFSTRTGARRDNIDDAATDLADYTAQMALQTLDAAAASEYAGPDAAWVQLTPQEAMRMFAVETKAGSTGKPQANSDRDAWGVLLPLIQGLQAQIAGLRQQGPQTEWMVKPLIELLNETLKRMDDPAEVDLFIPVPPPPEPIGIDPMTGQPIMGIPGAQMQGGPAGPGQPPAGAPAPAGAPELPLTA